MKRKNLQTYFTLSLLFWMVFCSTIFAQYQGNGPYFHERGSIIINEISNGPQGSEDEYIEFVVVGAPNNPTAPVDISGWLIDDNNFAGTGQGNAPGHIIFGDCYTAVPPGSIIVVYNSGSPNATLPADDPTDADGDGVYIIPNTDDCLDACPSNPTTEASFFCPCANPEATPAGWQFGLRNSGDVVQVRDICETVVHAIHWGNVSLTAEINNAPVALSIGNSSQSGNVIRLNNSFSNDWADPNNYDNPSITLNETPGFPNSPENTTFINGLRNGTLTTGGGTIFDCIDTDAGDIALPTDVSSNILPIQLCNGEDISAFSPNYDASDENEPDALDFTFEYAFLLTNTNTPTYDILSFNQDGDFDFSTLPSGEYLVWGFSYIQTNGSVPVDGFLSSDINTVEDILSYTGCGFDGDVDVLSQNGDSIKVIISNIPAPAISLDVPPVCELANNQSNFNLTTLEDTLLTNTNQIINWYTDQSGQSPIAEPTNFLSGSGTIFASIEENGCESTTVPINLSVVDNPEISNVNIQDESCANNGDGSISFGISGGTAPYTIFINGIATVLNDSSTFVTNNLSSGNYEIFAENVEGCPSPSTFIEINSGGSANLDLGPDTTISLGESIPILGIADFTPVTVSWFPVDGILPPTSLDVMAMPVQTTTYIVTATDLGGCVASDTLTITVDGSRDVFVPNVFSPNGDGINDEFSIFADFSFYNLKEMYIFNRWGAQLFAITGMGSSARMGSWDGTFRGEIVDQGTYVYFFILEDETGLEFIFKGSVDVIR